MKRKIINMVLAACLATGVAVGSLPTAGLGVKAAVNPYEAVKDGLVIRESEINQLLTEDLTLPTTVNGMDGATVEYSVKEEDAKYVSLDGNTLKVTRPQPEEPDYKFTLTATVTPPAGVEVTSTDGKLKKEFPLTIRAGLSEEDYAGYVYVCFSVPKGKDYDVQQIHFFLSEDGMNWTALNGCNPIFQTGTDYMANIEKCGSNSVNYKVAAGTDIKTTTKGDASVLFPFEGRDQGVRDPYLIRGCKTDGSDSNKVWLLATDLNTHSSQYNGSKENNTIDLGSTWGLTSTYGVGSQKLFVWETEDWIHWERRYIDVGGEIDSAMAWAPEAIYNPVKNNYLVYWSGRVNGDGSSRNRLYCNETSDFKTFGPTRLYEQEPFYLNHGANGIGNNSGYGNIDTSQLWVAGKDAQGNDTPYGTLFRVVKDETDNHVELQSAKTVLDPDKNYETTLPTTITPYTKDGVTYSTKEDLSKITSDGNGVKRADVVYNWYKNQSVGNHFQKVSQKDMEKYKVGYEDGNYEGATMFKFIDRDEWCVMIDNYGDMQIRYEPYLTTDLSKPDSIKKAEKGTYGRAYGDVGTHGGMIPITVKEYNTLIDTYNADSSVSNYHKIDYISVDSRKFDAKREELKQAAVSNEYTDSMKAQMTKLAETEQAFKTSADVDALVKRADKLLANKTVEVPEMQAGNVYLDEEAVTICTKATEGLKKTATIHAEADIDSQTSKITFKSDKPAIASVNPTTGVVTAKKAGSAKITATAPGGAKAVCKVTVKGVPSKITLNNKKAKQTVSLKVKKTFQIKVNIPSGTVCSKFNYKCDKPKIVSVAKSGGNTMKVTAKKAGTAKITVTAANNSKAKAVLTVKVSKK